MVFDGIPSLLPMKQYLSVFNTVVTVLLNAAPIVNFINVSRGKESYTNIPPLMLIVNLGNNIIWGCYWIRQSEYISCLCSSLSGVFSTVYIIWYSVFASKKKYSKIDALYSCSNNSSSWSNLIFLFRNFIFANSRNNNYIYHTFAIYRPCSKHGQSFP